MANRIQLLDNALKSAYEQDIDWSLFPSTMRLTCRLFGKGMKQQETTVLLGFLTLISFCLGHAAIEVQQFWTEAVITWMVVVLPTGRCKSAFHHFLNDIMHDVDSHLKQHGHETKQMFLPFCTWDKFGDILANSGGRSIGLYDEVMSFFATMNMYSSTKLQVSDTKEYQDFLQMYTGKTKTRETVTGNANFHMDQTSFTLLGFTQPRTAMPIIEDSQNNAKGFTSRLLWYFPTPIFCKMQDTMLTEQEKLQVIRFKDELVKFLGDLYVKGESTYVIKQNDKKTDVEVNRTRYQLSQDALAAFEAIHDDWELNICEKYPYDALIGGLFSRGRSHLLRLSLPIQLFCQFHDDFEQIGFGESNEGESHSSENDNNQDENSNKDSEGGKDSCGDKESSDSSTKEGEDPIGKDGDQADDEPMNDLMMEGEIREIHAPSIAMAASIVKCSLTQLCILTKKEYATNANIEADDTTLTNASHPTIPQSEMNRLIRQVMSTPGKTISFSLLNQKGTFRKTIHGHSGKYLVLHLANNILPRVPIGQVQAIEVPGNKTMVYFFVKDDLPEPDDDTTTGTDLIRHLAKIGMDISEYTVAFNTKNEESEKHLADYLAKTQRDCHTSPSKRPRTETL